MGNFSLARLIFKSPLILIGHVRAGIVESAMSQSRQNLNANRFGWWILAIVFGLAIIASSFISGLANIYAWKSAAGEGIIFGFLPKSTANIVLGSVSEIVGVCGLIVCVMCYRASNRLAALVALTLTLSASGFNGYSSFRYFTIVAQDKVEDVSREIEQRNDNTTEIEALQDELKAIGSQRPTATIQQQIDSLPVNRITRRDELLDERGWAERAEKLQDEIEALQTQQIAGSAVDQEANKELVKDDNVWMFAAVFLEAFKLLGFWLLASTIRTEVREQTNKNTKRAAESKASPDRSKTRHPVHDQQGAVKAAMGKEPKLKVVKPKPAPKPRKLHTNVNDPAPVFRGNVNL